MDAQCTARAKSTGERCKRRPIPGGTVCKKHGGGAPQVQRSARARLLEAADPAAARLVEIMSSEDERVAVKAAQLILDRAGYGPTAKLEHSGPDGGPIETSSYTVIDPKVLCDACLDKHLNRVKEPTK